MKIFLTLLSVFFITILSTQFALAETETPTGLDELKLDVEGTYQDTIDATTELVGPSQNNLYSGGVDWSSKATLLGILFVGTENMAVASTADLETNETLKLSYMTKNGLYGVSQDAMAVVMNNQPSLNVYAHLVDEWVPGQQSTTSVYAAERGYDYLIDSGISGLWQKMRNFAYVMFVIVLIVIGFMIMFRSKIGGQTAVTVMNTIPNVIVSLILVTFSFAIVGLLINIGGVLINVFSGVLELGDSAVQMNSIFSVAKHFFTGGGADVNTNLAVGLGGAITGGALGSSGSLVGGITLGSVAAGLGAITGILATIIVLTIVGAVIWASIKVFFTLITAYANILLDTILAPIYLAIAAIPGQENIRADWLRRIIKNILVFPLVFAIVNFGTFLLNQGIELSFPGILVGSDSNYEIASWMVIIISRIFVIYLYFLAAKAPMLLADFLPQAGGKNMAEAFKSAAQGIPLLGGLVGK